MEAQETESPLFLSARKDDPPNVLPVARNIGTLIRVKRKRNDEEADSLLVASIAKKHCSPEIDTGSIASARVLRLIGCVPAEEADLELEMAKYLSGKVPQDATGRLQLEQPDSLGRLMERVEQKDLVPLSIPYRLLEGDHQVTTSGGPSAAQPPPKCVPLDNGLSFLHVYDLEWDKSKAPNLSAATRDCLDNESAIMCNNTRLMKGITLSDSDNQPPEKEVYDLFFTDTPFLFSPDVIVELAPIPEDVLYEQEFIHHQEEDQECCDDEEDSNDENNWRNFYPDRVSTGSDSSEDGFHHWQDRRGSGTDDWNDLDNHWS